MLITKLKDVSAQRLVLTLNVLWISVAIVVFAIAMVCLYAVSALAQILVLVKARRRLLPIRKRHKAEVKNGNRKKEKREEECLRRQCLYSGNFQQHNYYYYRLEGQCVELGFFWGTRIPRSK